MSSDGAVIRRPGGRSARVRSAVLAATLDELLAVGYGQMKIGSIAARAHVNKTTIYRRWPTPRQLVVDALRDQAAEAINVPDTGSLRTDLLLLARAVAANIQSRVGGGLLRVLIGESPSQPEIAEVAHSFWSTRFAMAGEVVRRAVARGELPADTDADVLLEDLVGPLFFRELVRFAPISDERIVDHVDRLMAAHRRSGRRVTRRERRSTTPEPGE